MYVEVYNGNVMAAIATLKKLMKKEEILQDLKKHEFYVSPSRKARNKHENALKRSRQEERELQNAKFKKTNPRRTN